MTQKALLEYLLSELLKYCGRKKPEVKPVRIHVRTPKYRRKGQKCKHYTVYGIMIDGKPYTLDGKEVDRGIGKVHCETAKVPDELKEAFELVSNQILSKIGTGIQGPK